MKNKIIDTKFTSIFIILVISLISLVTISLASEKVDNNKYFIEENGMNEGSEFSDSVDENIVQNSKMSDETFESIEFIKPLENPKVTALFGERIHPITDETIFHSGIDIVSSDSDIVMAAADGSIIFTGYDASKGLHVEIEHADGSISSYAHASEIYVEVGDEVKAGEKIMKVGSTGMSTGPHLHFEVQNSDGEYVDINSMFD